MNICVYGSADVPDEKCMEAAKSLGSFIGKNGHNLVFGGFGDGLLGAVADEAYKNGAKEYTYCLKSHAKGIQNFYIPRRYSETAIKECGRNYRQKMLMHLSLCLRV